MIATFDGGDGASLSASVLGPATAPALVLLHSLGCCGDMWAPQTASLAGEFRLVVPDSRGHGRSSAPDGSYSLDRLGQDVLDVMDGLGIPGAHVCGLSMGGLVAQWLAVRAPARVDRLALANTGSRLGSSASWLEREATVRANGMAAIAETVLGRFLGEAFQAAEPQTTQRIRRMILQTPPQGYAGCCAALRCADLTGAVTTIRSRTLVLGGTNDVSTPPELTQRLQAAIPGAKLHMLDTAHLSSIEQPEAFTAALRAHLATEAR